jgi:hypothetical protein
MQLEFFSGQIRALREASLYSYHNLTAGVYDYSGAFAHEDAGRGSVCVRFDILGEHVILRPPCTIAALYTLMQIPVHERRDSLLLPLKECKFGWETEPLWSRVELSLYHAGLEGQTSYRQSDDIGELEDHYADSLCYSKEYYVPVEVANIPTPADIEERMKQAIRRLQ